MTPRFEIESYGSATLLAEQAKRHTTLPLSSRTRSERLSGIP
jgi:hypothetical protein